MYLKSGVHLHKVYYVESCFEQFYEEHMIVQLQERRVSLAILFSV